MGDPTLNVNEKDEAAQRARNYDTLAKTMRGAAAGGSLDGFAGATVEYNGFIVSVAASRKSLVKVAPYTHNQNVADSQPVGAVKAGAPTISRVAVPDLSGAVKSAVEAAVQVAAKTEGFADGVK